MDETPYLHLKRPVEGYVIPASVLAGPLMLLILVKFETIETQADT